MRRSLSQERRAAPRLRLLRLLTLHLPRDARRRVLDEFTDHLDCVAESGDVRRGEMLELARSIPSITWAIAPMQFALPLIAALLLFYATWPGPSRSNRNVLIETAAGAGGILSLYSNPTLGHPTLASASPSIDVGQVAVECRVRGKQPTSTLIGKGGGSLTVRDPWYYLILGGRGRFRYVPAAGYDFETAISYRHFVDTRGRIAGVDFDTGQGRSSTRRVHWVDRRVPVCP
jgi:hypothetical protein